MRKVALVGAGVSKFGVRKASYRDLIWEAGKACFDSVPAVKPKDLDGLVVGSVMPERTAFQSHISSMAAEALGIRPSSLSARTEHMCASGTVGIRYAYAFIAAGLADLVMVLGREREARRRRQTMTGLPLPIHSRAHVEDGLVGHGLIELLHAEHHDEVA